MERYGPGAHGKDKFKAQFRRLEALSQSIRVMNSRMLLMQEDAAQLAHDAGKGVDIAPALTRQYDIIGNDLKDLVREWEGGRDVMKLSTVVLHGRSPSGSPGGVSPPQTPRRSAPGSVPGSASQSPSGSSPQSPRQSSPRKFAGSKTTIPLRLSFQHSDGTPVRSAPGSPMRSAPETPVRSASGSPRRSLDGTTISNGGSPAEAFNMLNSGMSPQSTGSDASEVVFEAVSRPFKLMTREEKKAKYDEEQRKRANLRKTRGCTRVLCREVEGLLRAQPGWSERNQHVLFE